MIAAEAIPIEFEHFRKRAHQLTGMALTSYKAPQMHRRLSALLTRLRIDSFAEYARVLERDAARRQEFRDYVTINVSEFFRDANRFADLEQRVLPELLKTSASLRVWSAGCSFGAEAYSIAIMLQELAPRGAHTVLASDVDQTILDRARAGTGYLASDVRNVGVDRTQRWLVAEPHGRFAIGPAPRTMIRFVRQDLLTDAYPSGRFDLIACRNVVIYFTAEAKERIYQKLVHSLRPRGVLFLGGTEAIMRPQSLGLSVTGPGFYRKDG
jgi:chemotaxis protein methyltransferase CheR